MNKHPRNLAPVLIAGVLIVLAFGAVWAADYTVVFDFVTGSTYALTLGSPHGGTDYRWVNSKFNQPRTTGTNPHRGVDIESAYGTALYAPWAGWVVLASGTDWEMYLDLNNDSIKNDNAFYRFDHLSSIRISTGYVTKGTWVASSGDENGTTPAHLHFGMRKDTTGDGVSDVWIRNEPYHSTVAAWDYGRRIDFLSKTTWSTSNVAAGYCYGADENSSYEDVALADVTFFHRLNGTSAWSALPASTKNGGQFSVSFAGRYSPGQTINWMMRCNRTAKKSVLTMHWAFEPPKFAQPAADPNSTAAAYLFFYNTMN